MNFYHDNNIGKKRKISQDYNPDPNCTIKRPDGLVVTLPTAIIRAIRSGELKFKKEA